MNTRSARLLLCLLLISCTTEPEGLSEHRQEIDTLVAEMAFHGENLGKAITSLELLTDEISETGDTTAEELVYYKALQEKSVSDIETNYRELSKLTSRITTATALLTKREDFLPYYESGGKYHGHATRLHESTGTIEDSTQRAAVSIQNSREAIDALDMRSTSTAIARLEELEKSGKIAIALEAYAPYKKQMAVTEAALLEYKKTSRTSVAWKAKADFWGRQETLRAQLAKPWIDAKKEALEGLLNVSVALTGPTFSDSLYGIHVDTSVVRERLDLLKEPLDRAIEEEDAAWARYDAL